MVLRCGATFQCPTGASSSAAPFSSTCSFGHLQFISQTVLGICENRAWGWSITSGSFVFKAGFSTGQFWGRLVAGVEEHIHTWLLHGVEGRNKLFLLFPPSHCPCKTVENSWKALGGGKGGRTQGKGGAGASTWPGWDSCEVQTGIDASPGSSPCWGFPTGQLPSLHVPGLCFRSYIHIPVLFSHFSQSPGNSVETLHGWETAALAGEAPFPKKKGLFFRVCSRFCCC